MKKYEWMRNDTAAIMFSAIDDKRYSRILRFSAVLKDEEVDYERLKEAVKSNYGLSIEKLKAYFILQP